MITRNKLGKIQVRQGNGKFRRAKLSDFVSGVNEKGQVFICNVCEKEFVPVMLEGICCGVNDKRPKPEPELTEEAQAIKDKIQAVKDKPFINRQDLLEIQRLEFEFRSITKK